MHRSTPAHVPHAHIRRCLFFSPGDVILQSWLSQHAISPSLAFKYAQSGWLKKRGNGVYARAGREPEWNDALACLQNQLAAPVYVAD